MQTNTAKYLFIVILSHVISGCATKMSDYSDEDSKTMQDIYNGTFNNRVVENGLRTKEDTKIRVINNGNYDLRSYTRDASNEIDVLFRQIPNPLLVGYVYPHLTIDSIPIPAYSIPFRMSPKDYFAMPGEDQDFE